MSTLKVIGSGSKGNNYIIEAGDEHLLLDLGCKWSDILQGLNYDISNCYALVTHIHGDHSKSIPNALNAQIPVYSCQEVANKFDRVNVLQPKTKYKIGGFIVIPLPVEHNVQNFAYIITHDDFGTLAFCTDAVSFPYKARGINHLLIEMNYDDNIIIDNLVKGYEIRSHNEYHMEVEQSINAIKRNISPDLRTLCLIHLSDSQSSESGFKQRIFDEFGLDCYIAEKGVEIPLDKFDF